MRSSTLPDQARALVGEARISDSAARRSGRPHPTAKVPNTAVPATTMPLTRNTRLNPPASASHPRIGLATTGGSLPRLICRIVFSAHAWISCSGAGAGNGSVAGSDGALESLLFGVTPGDPVSLEWDRRPLFSWSNVYSLRSRAFWRYRGAFARRRTCRPPTD
jgi:hypothetical protein